jgi:hypothetical protein
MLLGITQGGVNRRATGTHKITALSAYGTPVQQATNRASSYHSTHVDDT